MLRSLFLFVGLAFCTTAAAQYPDGTLVFSSKKGLVGNAAKRITGGDEFTHVGIVLGGRVYDSDWPRAHSTPVRRYGKRGSTNVYLTPTIPYSRQAAAAMHARARATVGQPYRLRGYFRPARGRAVDGTWCSPYVARILAAGGRYPNAVRYDHEPQDLYNHTWGGYIRAATVYR